MYVARCSGEWNQNVFFVVGGVFVVVFFVVGGVFVVVGVFFFADVFFFGAAILDSFTSLCTSYTYDTCL